MPNLAETLDKTPFAGLAVTFVQTGFNASVEFQDGIWSPQEFAISASEAILKCLQKHAPAEPAAPEPAAPEPAAAPLAQGVPPLPY